VVNSSAQALALTEEHARLAMVETSRQLMEAAAQGGKEMCVFSHCRCVLRKQKKQSSESCVGLDANGIKRRGELVKSSPIRSRIPCPAQQLQTILC
jgi:hypothetical protein